MINKGNVDMEDMMKIILWIIILGIGIIAVLAIIGRLRI